MVRPLTNLLPIMHLILQANFDRFPIFRLLWLIGLTLCLQGVIGQDKIPANLRGYWEGSFIAGNAQQGIQIQFYEEEGIWKCLQIMEEWHPQFGEFVQPVEISESDGIQFNTGYGRATMQLDAENLEMIGRIAEHDPPIKLHLKKVPSPPPPDYELLEVRIPNQGIELYGHLHKPKWKLARTAIILAGGRGCYAGNTKFNLYGKLFRAYGIAVLAFHKRGNGNSGGDCDTATIHDLAGDLQACRSYLKQQFPEIENIGILGSSAGGWVMLRAHEIDPFDFLIGVVGPSTSVFDQQMQSMQYGLAHFDLDPEVRAPLLEYTRMMFDAKPRQRKWRRFQELLDLAELQGWKKLLENTDIPENKEDIEKLWVRRHNFDPGPMLGSIYVPYLAFYGEADWVVPYQENITLLENAFKAGRRELLTTIVAPSAQHGTEVKAMQVELPGNSSYWRFFRISPRLTIAIISFLERHDLIGK